jgi:hypothetical protein
VSCQYLLLTYLPPVLALAELDLVPICICSLAAVSKRTTVSTRKEDLRLHGKARN